jgi:hypothetical protein
LPGVVGLGMVKITNGQQTDKDALIVFVRKNVRLMNSRTTRYSSFLDNTDTDVIEIGEVFAHTVLTVSFQ